MTLHFVDKRTVEAELKDGDVFYAFGCNWVYCSTCRNWTRNINAARDADDIILHCQPREEDELLVRAGKLRENGDVLSPEEIERLLSWMDPVRRHEPADREETVNGFPTKGQLLSDEMLNELFGGDDARV